MSRKDENRSCTACRYSGLKCSPDCPLAAYFPATGSQDFEDVIQMYHPPQLKETLRLLKNRNDRDAAVGNIILQARRHRQSRRAAGIQEQDAVQAQLQDINRRHVLNFVPGPGPLPVPGSGLDENRTCAACKHSRLKCSPDCPLAVYFPFGGTLDFLDVIRMYNPSQLKETLLFIKRKSDRDAAVKTIILEARRRRAAGIEHKHRVLVLGEPIRDATGPGQETETRSGSGSSSDDATTTTQFGSGSGPQMDPGRRVFGLGQPIGSGQEMETRSGSGSRNEEVSTEIGSRSGRTGREFGLGESTMADLYRLVSPILKSWIHQEMEARSESGSRNEEVTTEFWTPEDGDMTWIEDTIKYFFEGEE